MRAKYYCSEIEKIENSAIAHLNGVEGTTTDDDVDNNQFNLAAPIGRLQIWIDTFYSCATGLDKAASSIVPDTKFLTQVDF